MSITQLAAGAWRWFRTGLISIAMLQLAFGDSISNNGNQQHNHDGKTDTPIKHVIVIIGEKRTFDHVFATYQPKHGQTVRNLLSEGVVNADGTPGPNFAKARRFSAPDQARSTFLMNPPKSLSGQCPSGSALRRPERFLNSRG